MKEKNKKDTGKQQKDNLKLILRFTSSIMFEGETYFLNGAIVTSILDIDYGDAYKSAIGERYVVPVALDELLKNMQLKDGIVLKEKLPKHVFVPLKDLYFTEE